MANVSIKPPNLFLTLSGEKINLEAGEKLGEIDWRYHEEFRGNPIVIGSIDDLSTAIKELFQVEINTTELKKKLTDFGGNMPLIKKLVDTIFAAQIVLTDVVVSPQKGEYELGIGIRPGENNQLKVGQLSIDGFSFGIGIKTGN